MVAVTALRIACLPTTRTSDRPRERAASTYSERSTSSRFERRVRTTTTARDSPIVRAGRVRVRKNPDTLRSYPDTGNQPSLRPRSSASISPSQNVGMANANVVAKRIALSAPRLGRTAAKIASGMPMSSAKARPYVMSSALGRSRGPMT